ncbi:beach-domain-containing protein [Microstroma glucosiphilum]|uniref:Beige protein homolog 1 n=1 Tax=Pseudomicrostroma glucosiphilum TaxID=1684307 RepID=A0A316U065_9BASI|nr:beach-domain-containing protein [Pseudomicrostroma glucosiphilum]PWN18284.1 beach-domain-containing protein [Pseudomicrostroma glucosiphilum]
MATPPPSRPFSLFRSLSSQPPSSSSSSPTSPAPKPLPDAPPSPIASPAKELPTTKAPTIASERRSSVREELRALLHNTAGVAAKDLDAKLLLVSQLHSLTSNAGRDSHVREDFAALGGFLVLVQVLSSLGAEAEARQEITNDASGQGADSEEQDSTKAEEAYASQDQRLSAEVFRLTLAILAEVIARHHRNLLAFEIAVGWDGLASALEVSNLRVTSPDHFFAALLGLALGDVSSKPSTLEQLRFQASTSKADGSSGSTLAKQIEKQWLGDLLLPQVVELIVEDIVNVDAETEDLWLVITGILEALLEEKSSNSTALKETCITHHLLSYVINAHGNGLLAERCLSVMKRAYDVVGLPDADGKLLLSTVSSASGDESVKSILRRLLVDLANAAVRPNSVTFDMSTYGHSSVAVSSLQRPFPPGANSQGWSYFTTFSIDRPDPAHPVGLLHLFDAQRTCSVKLEITPDRSHLRYTTHSSVAPAEFTSFKFEPQRLYHFAFVHQRPKSNAQVSPAQLYIDGVLVEQLHAVWPPSPPATGAPVRAVFGTAPSVEQMPARNRSQQKWTLGPAYLVDQCLPADFGLVLKQLGPSYRGNLQDSLGRFLTYQASTAINLRLDAVVRSLTKDGAAGGMAASAAEKELSRHPLVTAIAGRSSELFNEERFYFAFNASCTAIRTRPSSASSDLPLSHRPDTTVLLNQGVTLTREAAAASFGYAKVYGSPTMIVPSRLDDVIWKAGGCSVPLTLIGSATSSIALLESLTIFLQLLKNSWRLCEDAEQARAYEILNLFLRQKAHLMTLDALAVILSAVGLDQEATDRSALVNPIMYRIVLLDFDLWSLTPPAVQTAHLGHFAALLRSSKHRRFNIKRVAKMNILKKFLYALRNKQPDKELMRHILDALRNLLITAWSDVSLRSLTSYLASQLAHRDQAETPSRRQSGSIKLSNSRPVSMSADITVDLPLQVFETFASLALDRPAFLSKFGQVVNIKWLMLFLHPQAESRAAVLSLELLSRLLIREPAYVERLTTTGGWKVLDRLVPHFWAEPSVLPICFSVLFGQERQQNTTLSHLFAPPKKVYCAPMLRVILGCLRESLDTSSGRLDTASARRRPVLSRARPSETMDVPSPASKERRHARRRSNSMNLDAKSLADSFRSNSQQVMIRETAALIQSHAAQSVAWRELLFSSQILSALCEALESHVLGDRTQLEEEEMTSEEKSCNDLLELLARLATESVFVTDSTTIMSGLMASIPLGDLAQQSAFRFALIAKVLKCIDSNLSSTGTAGKDNADEALTPSAYAALAEYIEQASYEVPQGSTLEDRLLDTVTALLTTGEQQNRNDLALPLTSLHSSLNRIALYRLSCAELVSATFERMTQWQTFFFGNGSGDTFLLQCLVNRAMHYVRSDSQETASASLQLLKLIASTQPEMIAEALSSKQMTLTDLLTLEAADLGGSSLSSAPAGEEDTVYESVWTGFVKSAETLHTATHLERVAQLRQLLDQSESKERSLASMQRRILLWQDTLCASEEDRYIKHLIDVQELTQTATLEWQRREDDLHRERGLLGPEEDEARVWQLDPIEGPRRMRKRLMEQPKTMEDHHTPLRQQAGVPTSQPTVEVSDAWNSSAEPAVTAEPAPATEEGQHVDPATPTSAGMKPSNSNSGQEGGLSEQLQGDADDHEYKFRKVLRSLERGDQVEGVVNASRVVGIDCRAALCITGKLCLYLVDDYFQRSNGELVNVWQAPEAERDEHVLAALSSDSDQPSALIDQLEGDGKTKKWPWSALRRVHRRTFLHRGTALELFFEDGQSCLLLLPTVTEANALYKDLGSRCRAAITGAEQMKDGIREPASSGSGEGIGGFAARIGGALSRQTAGVITEAWRQRKISNFDYLMKLNTLAGRSFNDLSQYPVFPWVLADYESEELDLSNPASFRKLELPMGAQAVERRKQFEERYESLLEIDETPFHYGTHFSTAATTAGYLIRLRPFEKLLMALQGGTFDLAERTFASIEKAWKSSSEVSRGDVRELTPEFFYLPDFLVNRNRFDFGSTQAGTKIDDVELPPWAKGDPLVFVQKNREALESEYVSSRLHLWIDLIFGYKQGGEEAIKAFNVFHPLSYPGEVDLDSMTDANERRAASQTVWNFGVCPARLFERPHVPRKAADKTFELHTSPWMAIQSIVPLRTLKSKCHFIYADNPEKAYGSPSDYLIMPKLGVSLSAGHLDGSLRMFKSTDPARPIAVAEQAGIEQILCMTQAGPVVVVAGCKDGMVLLWKVDVTARELQLQQPLRGHTAAVTCLAASQSWRIAVSGSDDETAIVWDTNRGEYVRSLWGHSGPVTQVAVDEEEGHVATASGQDVYLWSINGELLAHVAASSRLSEPISTISFISKDSHTGRLAILLTGHKGKVIAWSCEHMDEDPKAIKSQGESGEEVVGAPEDGSERPTLRWKLQPFHVFEHQDRLSSSPPCNITAIALANAGRTLFTGDEAGRINVWTFPGEAFGVPEGISDHCMGCSKRWGVLETRRTCRGCGGIFCGACSDSIQGSPFGSMRFCPPCRDVCSAA